MNIGAGFMNVGVKILIRHSLQIGNHVFIGWNCTILDDDLHHLNYADQRVQNHGIRIGNKVWLGCNVTLLKGSIIPDGCVVAANSLVNSKFDIPNTLLAGSPARVVKTNITWSE
jgi:acetyltransferase-like isoleucine patch superfamily enzyme